jgi:hypothetical protein
VGNAPKRVEPAGWIDKGARGYDGEHQHPDGANASLRTRATYFVR